ncbi:MAG: glycosyltransferase, partial [Solirubrobacterales bacterium]
MRIALLHPTYWPEVRRGSERLAHDLGTTLADRGHQVTLLTSHRRRPSASTEDGIRVLRSWRPPELPGLSWYEDHVATVPAAIWRLLRGDYDLAHALFPADAWAAFQAHRRGGPPYVFSIHGIVNREALV